MNLVETENAAALAEIYGGDLADNGQQAESVEIDGVPVPGNLSFDSEEINLVPGGWQTNPKGVFYTLKQYFPNGFPRAMKSSLTCVINGHERSYQVCEVNGGKDNRAQLFIGLKGFANER